MNVMKLDKNVHVEVRNYQIEAERRTICFGQERRRRTIIRFLYNYYLFMAAKICTYNGTSADDEHCSRCQRTTKTPDTRHGGVQLPGPDLFDGQLKPQWSISLCFLYQIFRFTRKKSVSVTSRIEFFFQGTFHSCMPRVINLLYFTLLAVIF